jgi:hypothetical protein
MRPTSIEEYEKKASGGEPTWTNVEVSLYQDVPLSKALNWYAYHCSDKESKKYTIQYLKDKKASKNIIDAIDKVPEDKFKNLGFVCRMKLRGAPLTEKNDKWIENSIENLRSLFKESTKEEESKVEKVGPSIQERIEDKAREHIGELEGVIDDCIAKKGFTHINPYEWMQARQVKAVHIKFIVSFCEKRIAELQEVIASKDEQLVEGYSNFKRTLLKRYLDFLNTVVADCSRISHVAKVTRTPRKKKPKTTEKILATFQYKKEDKDFKVASINPADIIGASQLWVFNTKTRKLGCYFSSDNSGFGVKGTTLTNFEESKSIQKTVRKPETVLPGVITAGKVALRKTLTDINAVEQSMTGRINADTILLRVIK